MIVAMSVEKAVFDNDEDVGLGNVRDICKDREM